MPIFEIDENIKCLNNFVVYLDLGQISQIENAKMVDYILEFPNLLIFYINVLI